MFTFTEIPSQNGGRGGIFRGHPWRPDFYPHLLGDLSHSPQCARVIYPRVCDVLAARDSFWGEWGTPHTPAWLRPAPVFHPLLFALCKPLADLWVKVSPGDPARENPGPLFLVLLENSPIKAGVSRVQGLRPWRGVGGVPPKSS